MDFVGRHIQTQIEEALEWSRVVMLHGARQCGKTTLAQAIVDQRGGTYVSLDDPGQLQLARADPLSFLANQRHPLAVDEIQLGGDELIRAVKQLVDAEPTPGRFLLTGSTNFLTVPTISESLAGRVQIFRLWPLSEAELADTPPTEIDSWFKGTHRTPPAVPMARDEYLELICRGGYPEIVNLAPSRRRRWFRSYVETVTQRDIASLVDMRRVAALPLLLRWTAGLTSSHVNLSDAARRLEVSRPVITAYFEWLQTVFLVHELPGWTRNLPARPMRRPKFHLTDSGLAASLLGVDADALSPSTAPSTGPLLETFAVNEIARQISASDREIMLSHYRDNRGHEVDLILETPRGEVVSVEIKATRSPNPAQLEHLAWLRDKLDHVAPGAFLAGVLLHTGDQHGKIGDRLHLRPVSCLWSD